MGHLLLLTAPIPLTELNRLGFLRGVLVSLADDPRDCPALSVSPPGFGAFFGVFFFLGPIGAEQPPAADTPLPASG